MEHCGRKHLTTRERTCRSTKSGSALSWPGAGIKKEVMCHSAAGTPRGSESSLKQKQFYKSSQHMQQLSSCALKLKIIDGDRKPMEQTQDIVCRFLDKSRSIKNLKAQWRVKDQGGKNKRTCRQVTFWVVYLGLRTQAAIGHARSQTSLTPAHWHRDSHPGVPEASCASTTHTDKRPLPQIHSHGKEGHQKLGHPHSLQAKNEKTKEWKNCEEGRTVQGHSQSQVKRNGIKGVRGLQLPMREKFRFWW